MATRKPIVLGTIRQEIATGDTLLVPGHVSGSGDAAPTVSAGTLVAGSTDTRGGVTLGVSITAVTVTFARVFATGPWPLGVTYKGTGITLGITALSATAVTFGLSANLSGTTIYWGFME